MAVTYFGYCDPSTGAGTGTENLYNGRIFWTAAGYVCPGSGSQSVTEIGVESNDSPGGNFIVAVYDSVGDLVLESDAVKASAYPAAWVTWASANITWRKGTQLTGGATYRIAVCAAGNYRYKGTTVESGLVKYDYTDYSAGAPSTIPAGANEISEINVRVGTEPGGPSPLNPDAIASAEDVSGTPMMRGTIQSEV